MTTLSTTIERLEVNRRLTLRFLDHLARIAAAEAHERGTVRQEERLLAGDPSGGRQGSLGWNLVHVAVYEEGCCALLPPELWDRFRHGAPPGVYVAPLAEIADRLAASRRALLERVSRWREADLDLRPQGTSQPEMTRRQLLDAAAWHEPHHLTLCWENLQHQLLAR